jgi:plastocyanin
MAGFREVSIVRIGFVMLIAVAVIPRTGDAQGTVSGQVSLQERPGETTTDLSNTVVYLEPIGAPPSSGLRRMKETTEQMAMQSRQFSPRVRVVRVGSKIEFPNQDPFSHNIFSNAPGASFDLGLYGRGGNKSAEFKKAGAFPVYCNIHSRMTGFVVAVATPYYTQAGADGRYSLSGVPAGRYVAHFWHERAPEQTKEISIAAAGMPAVDAQLDARGYKFASHKDKFGQDYKASGERY